MPIQTPDLHRVVEINIVLHWKVWRKHGSVSHLFSCTLEWIFLSFKSRKDSGDFKNWDSNLVSFSLFVWKSSKVKPKYYFLEENFDQKSTPTWLLSSKLYNWGHATLLVCCSKTLERWPSSRTMDAQWSLFSSKKSQTFWLGQTIWVNKFLGILGIFGRFISTHFGTYCESLVNVFY